MRKIAAILCCLLINPLSYAYPTCPTVSSLQAITQWDYIYPYADGKWGLNAYHDQFGTGTDWFFTIYPVEGVTAEAAVKKAHEILSITVPVEPTAELGPCRYKVPGRDDYHKGEVYHMYASAQKVCEYGKSTC